MLTRLAGRRVSWLREVISSFRKTLCRWYCTVRGLMNSCAPISGFERPSLGESGDLCLLGCEHAARLVGALARGLTGGPELATCSLGKGLGSEDAEHVVGCSQLFARVDAPVFAPEPFAVDEVRAGELDADSGAFEPLDRIPVERLGGVSSSDQRLRAREHSEGPVRAGGACAFFQPR